MWRQFILTASVVVLGVFFYDLSPLAPMYKKIPPLEFLGPLTPNKYLDSAQRIFEGKIGKGPESLAVHPNGKMYTGLVGGSIIEIDGDKLRTLTKVGGANCVTDYSNRKTSCGRPLGMKIDKAGDLLVADIVKGIYKVNVKSGTITTLVPSWKPVDGKIINFADDVVESKTGDIYFSDASSSWFAYKPLWHAIYKNAPDGRILHYNPKTNEVKTVLDNLYFANGVELSANEEFLFVCETMARHVLKLHLKGPKKGQAEKLVILPGLTDNIRASGRGTYWVALVIPRVPTKTSLWDQLECCHHLQYLAYSSLQLIQNVLAYSKKIMPSNFIEVLYRSVNDYIEHTVHQGSYGLVVEINENGDILRSLHGPKGYINLITEAREHQGTLYLASFFNQHLGKLKLQ